MMQESDVNHVSLISFAPLLIVMASGDKVSWMKPASCTWIGLG